VERERDHAPGVEGGEGRGAEAGHPQEDVEAAVGEGVGQDLVLGEVARQERQSRQRRGARERPFKSEFSDAIDCRTA